ncbi:uncharacterized protein FTJAE_13686 [Fusarium tjaetaba]|uniref:Uncharacterized protein n=1 Tax=Fusarium tjaetaba TaxID=1567544 RepID=A0A8H5QG04_9HYPO|nr:uncharacterized protein FTJAE_13686 [Fusarium tjaetaba]KAF5614592.1 hypothetical protein FTJAE_13686 [Fusarium tjaetaba]
MESSGPPKGYTKALETRLRETEMVLIRVLQSTNDQELLARAFNDDTKELGFNERITEHSMGEQRMLALMNHWERFPLRTADNVVQWIEETSRNSNLQDRAGSQTLKRTGEVSQLVEHSHDIAHQPEADIESHVGSEDDLSVESRHGHATSISLPPIMELSSEDTVEAVIPAEKAHEVRNTAASSIIELPEDFKDQFLW